MLPSGPYNPLRLTLTSGTRLGVYEITALLGAGGMGEVYRATDTNLKRSVAIKVLPKAVAPDADRLARFQREAETLAALNHPHIAQIATLPLGLGSPVGGFDVWRDGRMVVTLFPPATTPAAPPPAPTLTVISNAIR